MERVRDNPDEEVKSLMENKSMRRIIFHSPTIRKTLKSKEVNMGKLTQEQMLIVKGTEHPEEFTPKRQEQGLLLTEIAKHIFHEFHPVTDVFPDYWGITGTMDDESWRRLEKHCYYSANQILSKVLKSGYLPVEPVQLEVLRDKDMIIAVCGDCPSILANGNLELVPKPP